MPFSFSHPDNPREDDPRFDTEREAVETGLEYQRQHPWEQLLAIWDDDYETVEAILHWGEIYASPDYALRHWLPKGTDEIQARVSLPGTGTKVTVSGDAKRRLAEQGLSEDDFYIEVNDE